MTKLRCLRCQQVANSGDWFDGCRHCQSQGVLANLVIDEPHPDWTVSNQVGMARYAAALPRLPIDTISLGEGQTPLISLRGVAGHPDLFLKDESQNPTWSHKDRYCVVSVAHAKVQGYETIGVASTGNHAASAAAYAARAGLACLVFTTPHIPSAMRRLVEGLGGVIVPIARKDDRRKMLRVAVEAMGVYPVGTVNTPPIGDPHGVEGYKSIAYEISEALDWKAPAYVVAPVGHGDCFFGIWKGFKELKAVGKLDFLPRMVGVEVVGALTQSWRSGLEAPEAVEPRESIAFSISGNQVSYQALVALRESNGQAVVVSDYEVNLAHRLLGTEHGIFTEYSAAAAMAGALRLSQLGHLGDPGPTVVISTSSGLKNREDSVDPLTPITPSREGLHSFLNARQVQTRS